MNKHEEHEDRELVREHAENPERFERIDALGKGRDAFPAERKTPITDSATFRSWIWDALKCDYAPGESAVPARVSADLERQLSEARDGWREEIARAQADMRRAESQINRLRERLDEASYQRDVLADAVEQLMTYRPNGLSGEDQHEIAVWREVVDALATVKGVRHE